MKRAIGIVMAMENTPHGLWASARTTTSASTAIRITMMMRTPNIAATTAPPPGGDPQHQVVLDGAAEHRADDNPDAARQITHLSGQHGTDERPGTGDGGEVMAEHHAPIRRQVIGAVVENFGRRRVVVARTNDLHLDQPRVEPEADDVGADRRDHKPDRVHRLAASERNDRPGAGTDHGDYAEDDLVPDGDGGAVDYRDGWQLGVGADVADITVVLGLVLWFGRLLGHAQTLRRSRIRPRMV